MGRRGFGTQSKVVGAGFSDVTPRRVAKVRRNDPCPCGAGRKYKDCHERDGHAFLDKLARERDAARMKAEGVPWYKRLLLRS